jgi:hypothetical protein
MSHAIFKILFRGFFACLSIQIHIGTSYILYGHPSWELQVTLIVYTRMWKWRVFIPWFLFQLDKVCRYGTEKPREWEAKNNKQCSWSKLPQATSDAAGCHINCRNNKVAQFNNLMSVYKRDLAHFILKLQWKIFSLRGRERICLENWCHQCHLSLF